MEKRERLAKEEAKKISFRPVLPTSSRYCTHHRVHVTRLFSSR